MEIVKIFTDGATVGHNGKLGAVKEVGIGIWVPHIKKGYGKRLPGISNNEAEFHALIHGMKIAKAHGFKEVFFFMDSKIILNRANGMRPKKAKFQNPRMDAFQNQIMDLKQHFDFISFEWVPREQNTHADAISKHFCKKTC